MTTKPLRDSQRQKLYNAERAVPFGVTFDTVEDCQRYVNKVWASPWTLRRFVVSEHTRQEIKAHPNAADYILSKAQERKPPIVRPGHGSRSAFYRLGTITLPKWARNERVILHEIVHALRFRHVWNHTEPPHGWQFANTFLELVRHFMGREAHDTLKASFRKHKVRFRPPRPKRQLTPERLAALRAQAARMHEIRRAAKAPESSPQSG